MLGDTLISKGLLTKEQLDKAIEEQKKTPRERLGAILVKLGYVTNAQVEASL